jgi:hypothetical protein
VGELLACLLTLLSLLLLLLLTLPPWDFIQSIGLKSTTDHHTAAARSAIIHLRADIHGSDIDCGQRDYQNKAQSYCEVCGGLKAIDDACRLVNNQYIIKPA